MEPTQDDSAQTESESIVHDQQTPPLPPRVDESVEIMAESQIILRYVAVTQLSTEEKKARSGKESRRDQSTTITSLTSDIKSHVICLVLFILLRF